MNKILQQPSWPNRQQYLKIISRIKQYPQLVYPNEINKLKLELKEVARGNKFIIQGGDCAETFKNFSEDLIKSKLKILLQMSAIIQYSTKLKIVNKKNVSKNIFIQLTFFDVYKDYPHLCR